MSVGVHATALAARTADTDAEVERRAAALLAEAESRLRCIDPGWAPPPYDPLLIAQAMGIRCVEVGAEMARPALLCLRAGAPVILYRRQRDAAATAFCLFHEIAHTLFPDGSQLLGGTAVSPLLAPEGDLERLCDLAARELMLPRTRVAADLQGRFDPERLPELCRRYGARPEDVAVRMLDANTAPACAAVIVEPWRPPRWRRRQPGGDVGFALTWAAYSQPFRAGGRYLASRLDLPKASLLRAAARADKPLAGDEQLPLAGSGFLPCRVQAVPLRDRSRQRGLRPVLAVLAPQ